MLETLLPKDVAIAMFRRAMAGKAGMVADSVASCTTQTARPTPTTRVCIRKTSTSAGTNLLADPGYPVDVICPDSFVDICSQRRVIVLQVSALMLCKHHAKCTAVQPQALMECGAAALAG